MAVRALDRARGESLVRLAAPALVLAPAVDDDACACRHSVDGLPLPFALP